MFKVVKKQVRPNTSVEFYDATNPALRAYLLENYFLTGKMQRPEAAISADGLEKSTTMLFASEEIAREWKNDAFIAENHTAPMEAYSAANGIDLQPTTVIGEVEV